MSLLGVAVYDPAVAVNKETTALKAMTAFDTTNLRVEFNAPTNGMVLVRLKGQVHGATTFPRILLGILEGATVKARVSPIGSSPSALATTQMAQEATFIVSGLTPGTKYTWDAAYGVEVAVASTGIKYGGPNNTTTNDSWGGFIMEVWPTSQLLAGKLYDPEAAVTKSTTALLAMTVFDTTNLRHKIIAPASGRVLWRINAQQHGSTTFGQTVFGILEGATVKARMAPVMGNPTTAVATSCVSLEASGIITGLTAGTEYTFDAAYGVEIVAGAGGIKYGGPNNTTENDAFGGIAYEIWSA